MPAFPGTCPLSQKQLLDEYFMEHRAQILAVAAFLDRLERSRTQDAEHDFRLRAFRAALDVLTTTEGDRVKRIQMLLSDQDVRLLEERDQQNAFGASARHGLTHQGGMEQ